MDSLFAWTLSRDDRCQKRPKAVLENSRAGNSLSPSFVGAPSRDSGCGRAASVASEPSKLNDNRIVNCRGIQRGGGGGHYCGTGGRRKNRGGMHSGETTIGSAHSVRKESGEGLS